MASRHDEPSGHSEQRSTGQEDEATAPRPGGALQRREFLQQSAGTALAVGAFGVGALASPRARATTPQPIARVRGYRQLGKTGLEISDIGFGTGSTTGRGLVGPALERGITYFDTAESYPVGIGGDGGSETALGEELGARRKDIVLATKTAAKENDSRDEIMRRLEASLKRLRTDWVDVYYNHAVNDVDRLKNGAWFEFVERAKEQGKIRFSGMSGHGGRLVECLDFALDERLVDVILCAHNFGQDPAFYQKLTRALDFVAIQVELPRVMKKAHAQGVGVIAMKTLMGAKLNDLRPYEREGSTFAQAAFRWVLTSPDVDGLVITMKREEQLQEYLGASGAERVSAADMRLLERYARRNGADYCRHGCAICESACDRSAPLAELMRVHMYATDYGDLEQARGAYAELGAAATRCLDCDAPSCNRACPQGIDVRGRARALPDLLGLANGRV